MGRIGTRRLVVEECPNCSEIELHCLVFREQDITTIHSVCAECGFEMYDEFGPFQPAPLDASRAGVNPDCLIRRMTP